MTTTDPEMALAWWALALFAVYLTLGFVLRSVLQYRATGDTGFRGISGPVGSPRWWAGVLFVLALLTGVLGPIAALLGMQPIGVLSHRYVQTAAAVAAVVGIVLTVLAQLEMGSAWRIGVREGERTALVTQGWFSVVRNPIFSAMALTGAGLAFMVPNAVSIGGLVLLLVALQLQVRVVEEPYLRVLNGAAYTSYEQSVGRFVPLLGRRHSNA
ncbi:methyltransferase family protein [Nostocoides sp.]|jgi:protein-S-isoprenylcysteine O-methyltransferase Ste14|uniref:methyltransferase family protein n=1 Tax=Nostocoides sp. TaxID=1917966 RepID=UPI003BAF519E